MENIKSKIGIKMCNTCENNLRCSDCVYMAKNKNLREDIERYRSEIKCLEAGQNELAKRFYKMGVKDFYTKIRAHSSNDKILVSDILRIATEMAGDTE